MHVGAAPVPGGAREAGCEELPGWPGVTLRVWRKGAAPKERPRIAAAGRASLCRHGGKGKHRFCVSKEECRGSRGTVRLL